jgi:hypothetical protein
MAARPEEPDRDQPHLAGALAEAHQTKSFKLSPNPQFIDKVRDIVGLYLNPPETAVVLCVDEKSQIQALDRSAPVLPLLPGVPESPPRFSMRLPCDRLSPPSEEARRSHRRPGAQGERTQ